jgi:hypothetical protein
MKAKEFIIELKKESKPRNFVAKNAKMGGAGQHKDKKKAEKQGDVKHKKPFSEASNPAQQAAIAIAKKKKAGVKEAWQNDESNLWYIYDKASGRLKQRMIDNLDEPKARSMGYRDSIDGALKVAGIIRSKFNPKKFVQNQGGKWIEVHPFGSGPTAEDTELDEINWKKAAATGALALGALGAFGAPGHAQAADLSSYGTPYLQQVANGEHPRPMVSVDDARAELQDRANGKQQKITPEPSNSKSGYSKEYLQKAADPDRTGRYMISVEKAQDLLKQMDSKIGEGSMFAGAKVGHKEGPAGQWRNDGPKKNKPAKPGDLVGDGM